MLKRERFVRRMKDQRNRRGWSQQVLAREVEKATGYKISPVAITKLEWVLAPDRVDASRGLELDEALAIAETFGVTLDDMIGDDMDGVILAEILRADKERRRLEERIAESKAETGRLQDQLAEVKAMRAKLSKEHNRGRGKK